MSKYVDFLPCSKFLLISDSVTSGSRSAIPDWLAKRNQKSLKHDQEWRSRIELIQDFQFPEASINVKFTRDNTHIMATGVYKPQIRVFDLSQLAMKFERHTEAENIAFEILSDDWSKSVHLQSDRSIEFHTQFGMHYKTRIPKFGRDLAYYPPSCELYTCGAGSEIYRLNLEQGRFLNSLVSESPSVNVSRVNNAHGLLGFGGDDGFLEFWHPTQRKKLARIDVLSWLKTNCEVEESASITTLEFHDNGLTCAVGSSSGHVLLYDLRRNEPVIVQDHKYGFPIKKIAFHSTDNVFSSDTKGKLFTSIEPPHNINSFAVPTDSGLVAIANEGVPIETYYVPQLGPAPQWCQFLDNLTEELEENPNGMSLYDDYKFVSRKELSRLSLDHLIGTNVLKAYMHGFFLDLRLYQKAKAIANPFEFDEYMKKKGQERVESMRKSRIHAKLPKVNPGLAIRMQEDNDEEDGGKNKSKNKKKRAAFDELQNDDRFKSLFEDQEFQIDENSAEWKMHHPSEVKKTIQLKDLTPLEEEEYSDNAQIADNIAKFSFDPSKPTTKTLLPHQIARNEEKEAKMKLYAVEEEEDVDIPFAQRIKNSENDKTILQISSSAGSKSITFRPHKLERKIRVRAGEEVEVTAERRKRGVRDLGLRSIDNTRGRGRGRGRGSSRGGSRGSSRGRGRGGK